MALGDRLRELRQKLGMTQKQLAEHSGVTDATISRVESRQIKGLRGEALGRLAEALGVTVDYLLGRTDELTLNDVLKADGRARMLQELYGQLSERGRDMLIAFALWVRSDEQGLPKDRVYWKRMSESGPITRETADGSVGADGVKLFGATEQEESRSSADSAGGRAPEDAPERRRRRSSRSKPSEDAD